MIVHHMPAFKFRKLHPTCINPVFINRIRSSKTWRCQIIDAAGHIYLEIDILPHGPSNMGCHIHISRPSILSGDPIPVLPQVPIAATIESFDVYTNFSQPCVNSRYISCGKALIWNVCIRVFTRLIIINWAYEISLAISSVILEQFPYCTRIRKSAVFLIWRL